MESGVSNDELRHGRSPRYTRIALPTQHCNIEKMLDSSCLYNSNMCCILVSFHPAHPQHIASIIH